MTLLDYNGKPKQDLEYLNLRFSEIDFNQLVFKSPNYDWDSVFRTNLRDYGGKCEYFDRTLAANNFRTLALLTA